MATYNAGIVTAYGSAVQGGYTGTYEQFCADMAEIGTVPSEIGDLSNLTTTAKNNLVAAINEAAQSGGGSVSPYTSNPSALGTASAGSSDDYARGDHVHPMPSAANVGAIASPSSPISGQFLKWNGSAWVASDLPVYSGGVS